MEEEIFRGKHGRIGEKEEERWNVVGRGRGEESGEEVEEETQSRRGNRFGGRKICRGSKITGGGKIIEG
jgi:hypothetical protein